MAPPKRPWFRLYVELIHDRKLRTRPPAQRWLWIALLGMAASSSERGVLLIAEGVPADLVVIADDASLTVKETRDGLTYFESVGMVHRNEIDAWVVTAFLERQYESDMSTDRTSKHRSIDNERNVDEPFLERSDSVSVSLTLKEIKTLFEKFYEEYPLHKSPRAAEKAFTSAIKRADMDTIMAGVAAYTRDPQRDPLKTKYPATWLNADCWRDEMTPTARAVIPPLRAMDVKPTYCGECDQGFIFLADDTTIRCGCQSNGNAA